MKNLKNLREKIDEIDFLIIELLAERFEVVKEI
jgi:chorismate mutase type II